jgi:formamidopyrimidine-DNA glycosylase
MPELPEVQSVVETLRRKRILGRLIVSAAVYWRKTIAEMEPTDFCNDIKGQSVRQIKRRGKYIVFGLSGDLTLMIHLRMTGRLNWEPKDKPRNKHEHVILEIGKTHTLRFQDTRKFGRIWLTATPERILNRLGPEPLAASFTEKRFSTMLQTTKRQIKPLLLDQHFIAGLGNIYVDEALWEARIHPQRTSSSLTIREVRALHRAIPQVLHKGLRNQGTSLGTGKSNFYLPGNRPGGNADKLKVFRRTGKACPRCSCIIARIIVAQRSSHVCPHCQINNTTQKRQSVAD